tara:strand:+ start:637 stop:786 length:150 start_codon:yes stop_codon:yes gene_type:complete
MINVREFWKEFWNDGRDYYGDIKATIIFLTFCGIMTVGVIGVYWWLDKL